jgi:group I intron endonuclease
MPRKEHIYHYIYRITCLINYKYYIGLHSTSNLEDRYFGSGKVLKRSLNKYGKENHLIEILEWLPNRSSLKLREKEIVNESLLRDSLCMNLALGGGGGLTGEDHRAKFFRSAHLASLKNWNDPTISEKMNAGKSERLKKLNKEGKINSSRFTGKSHSIEIKNKIKESNLGKQLGPKNSQYGTCWIHKNDTIKKIKLIDLDLHLNLGWKKGRKLSKK